MNTWLQWLEKKIDFYPKIPLIYICSHNGVTGAVRAECFDAEVRQMRKLFREKGYPPGPVRPQVYPVFLFSNKTGFHEHNDTRVGTTHALQEILEGCAVEERIFQLPPIKKVGLNPYGYFGLNESMFEGSPRQCQWSLQEAHNFLHMKENPSKHLHRRHLGF